MSCKGVPKPSEYYLMTSVLSGIYMPMTVVGNLAIILTIIVDPLHELRTSFNLLYVNVLISDLLFGLLVDTYRTWGNNLRATGINLREAYPYTKSLGEMCHILFFGGQLVAFIALAVMSVNLKIQKDQRAGKVSYPLIAIVSMCIWACGIGFAFLYEVYGYSDVELVVISVSTFGTAAAIIANFFILYQPAKKNLAPCAEQRSAPPVDNVDQSKKEKFNSVIQMEAKISKQDEVAENKNAEAHDGKMIVEEGRASAPMQDQNIAAEVDPRKQHLRDVQALLLYYVIIFVFLASSCIIVYANMYDYIKLSCVGTYFLKGWKMMFIVSHKAINPFLCLLLIASLRRGCLKLLRLRQERRVVPKA